MPNAPRGPIDELLSGQQ